MTKYDIPIWQMCYEAAKELPETFRPIDVVRKIRERRPGVKENTIRAHVIALAPNHPSSKHYGMRHKLFYYLGNGNYRLLTGAEADLPQQTASAKRIGTRKSLDTADRLLNMGMYSQAIKEYGSIVERLLRQLYQEYFPNLPIKYKERILDYEREAKIPISKFTIGQWIGLFRYADLFRYIAQDRKGKGEPFIFFIPAILDALNKLRNISTHPTSSDEHYISQETALFVSSAMKCIIHEFEAYGRETVIPVHAYSEPLGPRRKLERRYRFRLSNYQNQKGRFGYFDSAKALLKNHRRFPDSKMYQRTPVGWKEVAESQVRRLIEGERLHRRAPVDWGLMLSKAEENTRRVVEEMSHEIPNAFSNVSRRVYGKYLCFCKGEPVAKNIFVAFLLTKKKLNVRIRTDPKTFKDATGLVKSKVYSGWFFKYGQEREFSISKPVQIEDAIRLIRHSYQISGE